MAQLANVPHATAKFNLIRVSRHYGGHDHSDHRHQRIGQFQYGYRFVKLAAVLTFIAVALPFVLKHPALAHDNWKVFLPPNGGSFGEFGWSGVARGASVVFFAYIGFDAVSTAAQEGQRSAEGHAHRHFGSLVVCTILYIAVSGLLTATVHYSRLNIGAPVSAGDS